LPESNSLFVIASHVLGMVEESILTGLCDARRSERDRDAEFRAAGDSATPFLERWQALRPEISAALDSLSRADFERVRQHPRRGEMTGYELLTMTIAHANEHKGHAELTRQWVDAQGLTAG
jgi:hypothetical protein